MYFNTIIVGHLGRDPEMRYTPDGAAVTSFNVATTRKWNDAGTGEPREKTTWVRVTAWRKLGELCAQYLTKGRLVLVEGEAEARAFTDREGNPRASLELTARNVKFLGRSGTAEVAEPETPEAPNDDIPF